MPRIERLKVVHPKSTKIMTQQAHKDEADINSIIKRWRAGSVVPENHRDPTYGDFSGTEDYHTELNRVNEAEEQFMRLPSAVRRNVENDVGQFLLKVQTEDGLKELIDLGLEGELAPPGVVAPPHVDAVPRPEPEPDPEPEG